MYGQAPSTAEETLLVTLLCWRFTENSTEQQALGHKKA